MKSQLLKRVEKLEAAAVGGEVTLAEAVWWSYRPESERCMANPAYAAYRARYQTSRLARLFEQAEVAYHGKTSLEVYTWIAA
jgi:hypothetical protein